MDGFILTYKPKYNKLYLRICTEKWVRDAVSTRGGLRGFKLKRVGPVVLSGQWGNNHGTWSSSFLNKKLALVMFAPGIKPKS